jgi:hypothetical protein
MFRLVSIGALSLVTAFIAYATYTGYVSYKAPRRSVSDYHIVAECSHIPFNSNRFQGSPLECEARLREEKLHVKHPTLMVREGDKLTIFYQGAPSVSLIPDLGAREGCDSYNLRSIVPTYDPLKQQMDYLAEISCHTGEFEKRFIVMPSGERWNVNGVMASPSGHLIGVGQNNVANDGFGGFTIQEWPSRKIVARFKPRCRVVSWQDDANLTVTCLHELKPLGADLDYYVAFDASVTRDQKQRWRMRTSRWLNPRAQDYNKAGDGEYAPTLSLQWPLNFKPVTN